MHCRFANFQNGETDPSTGQVHASPCLKLDKNDFIEGGYSIVKKAKGWSSDMDEWLAFYNPYFEKQGEAKKFVESCEMQSHPNNVAKIMMHQVQRLISLSDDMQKIRPNDDPLKLLILIMCVENVAKLHDGYAGESKSWHYVEKFFKDFLSDGDKDLLRNGFVDSNDKWLRLLSFEDVIKMLYKIRCDVVHEGDYLDFSFYDGKSERLEFVSNYVVTPHVTLQDVRDIIIRGCINAIQSKL